MVGDTEVSNRAKDTNMTEIDQNRNPRESDKIPDIVGQILDEYDVKQVTEKIEIEEEHFETSDCDEPDYFTGGIVYNDERGIALVKNEWSNGWITPGGTVEDGETLEEGLLREIEEETGLKNIEIKKPVYLSEQTFMGENRSAKGYFVLYTVRSYDTEIGENLGADDVIHDAGWFDEIPENVDRREILEELLEDLDEIRIRT